MWKKLEIKQLQKMIACESIEELKQQFNQQEYNKITSFAFKNRKNQIKHFNRKSHALVSAINASAVPIDTFWLVTGCIELGMLGAAALPVTIAVLAFGLLIGAYFFSESYKKKKNKKKRVLQFFQLADLKIQVFDELIQRETNKIALLNHDLSPELAVKNDYVFSRQHSISLKKSLSVGLTATAVLSITFLLGVSSFFETLGYISLVSALTGPIGLGIALGTFAVAIGIGAYLGYKHYQSKKSQYLIKSEKSLLTKQIQAKQNTYDALVRKREILEIMAIHENQSTPHEIKESDREKKECKLPYTNSISLFPQNKLLRPSKSQREKKEGNLSGYRHCLFRSEQLDVVPRHSIDNEVQKTKRRCFRASTA